MSYGGDAYTGIQNAAAQSANNAISVYQAIGVQNGNLIDQTKLIISALKLFFGFMILSVGLATFASSFGVEEYGEIPLTAGYESSVPYGSAAPVDPAEAYSPAPKGPCWTCTCGKQNPEYLSSCACGVSKLEAKLAAKETEA